MGLISVILLAVGLAMDCLAVSSTKGIAASGKEQTDCHPWLMAVLFGFFQGAMPLIAYAAGSAFATYIDRVDHWIALVLLTFIGGKMIWESLHEHPEEEHHTGTIAELFVLAIATSIDALATGIIFVPYSPRTVLLDMAIIAFVSFAFSLVGFFGGKHIGKRLPVNVELLGGLVLIGIGLKIFIEGMI